MATATVPRGRSSTNGTKPPDLDALREPPVGATGAILQIPLELIDVGPNVRVNVAEIDELAASIAEHGVLQPIKVRDAEGDRYLVTWGQRRVLAARKAGLERIPALVGDDVDVEKLSIEQLVENLHRADLNAIDRARAMRTVVDSGVTQAALAKDLGLAPSTIANDLGILDAPPKIQDAIERGELTSSHAKALKGLAPKTQVELASQAIKRQQSAHELEEAVQQHRRSEEWRKEREAAERKKSQVAAAALAASVEQIKKKKVPADAVVYVLSDTQNAGDNDRIAKLVREGAGFKNVKVVYRYSGQAPTARPKGGECDCTAWKIEARSSYVKTGEWVQKLSLTPACVKRAHQQAVSAAADKARDARWKLRSKVREQLANVIPGLVAQVAAPRFVLEAMLWQLLEYGLGDWAAENGGKRANPWARIRELDDSALAEHVGKALGKRFDDHFSYKVDWDAIAEQFELARPS